MARVHGGPDDGSTIPDAQAGNFVFNANALQSPIWNRDYWYALHADGDIYWEARPSSTVSPLSGEQNAARAWQRLTRALGVQMPAGLNRSAAARRRLRRVVR